MAFHVGQRVVCVDATSPAFYTAGVGGLVWPIEKQVYRITTIRTRHGVLGLQLAELPSKHPDGLSIFYQASRFRPLIERKTDTGMAILRKILDRTTLSPERELMRE